jgi:hypothetical protein
MVTTHQRIPQTRDFTFTASDPYQFNISQLLKITAHRVNWLKTLLSLWAGLKQWLGFTLGQLDKALSIQFQQGHTTTHLFGFAIGACPIKPLANSKGKSSARNRWLTGHRCIYFTNHLVRKLLTANQHGLKITYCHSLCPEKNVGHGQFFKGGTGGI